MMDLDQIKKWYSVNLHDKNQHLLREYLQYVILQALSRSKYGHRFVFLGGTCLRIVYDTHRFSEDLDFDNKDVTTYEFEQAIGEVQRYLERSGYTVSIRFVHKGAYHARITFPALLYQYSLSGHKEAKLLIKLDTEKQHYSYTPRVHTLDKFGIQNDVLATPPELLCAQKIAAVLGRKRPKGRDFYDLHWLLTQLRPDYGYLQQRLQIKDAETLRTRVADHIQRFDFKQLALDVEPFLFDDEGLDPVRHFPTFWAKAELA